MIRQGSIVMILWSYLLLSVSAGASIENVLAPVEPALADGPGASRERPGTRDLPSRAALVERTVDEIDLLAELERLLADRLRPAGALRLIPISPLPRVPRGAVLPGVDLVDHPARLTSSTVLLRFRLLDGDRLIGTHAVSFRAQVLANVWTPARRLAAGEPLLAGDLSSRETDLLREPRAVVADPSLFGRYEFARAVVPERTLNWTDIAPRSLVRKGELVEVVAQGGLLSVTMKGQATRSGAIGEVVTVRNLESKREFPAEVIDENRVRVHF